MKVFDDNFLHLLLYFQPQLEYRYDHIMRKSKRCVCDEAVILGRQKIWVVLFGLPAAGAGALLETFNMYEIVLVFYNIIIITIFCRCIIF